MKQNIHVLLKSLVDDSTFVDSQLCSSSSKKILLQMKEEFKKLSSQKNKQKEMITVYLGGIILALHKSSFYDKDTVDNALNKQSKSGSYINRIKLIGTEALTNLPEVFCGALFLKTNEKGAVFFPRLAKKSHEIDKLVYFCNNFTDLNETEVELNEEKIPQYSLVESRIHEFIRKHKQSYESGFFNRTHLKMPYNTLTHEEIIAHSKQRTFFGFKNRTCKILEEMEVLNAQGEVIDSEFKSSLSN